MKRVFPILAVLTGVLLSYALYEALIAAPTEQTMGPVQRIFYYHVPSAWTAFILFFINFFASIVYLIWRGKQSRYCCSGDGGSGSCLLHRGAGDGPIWARPVWGIWWTWDLRLTLTLVLWLIYVSYLVLRRFSSSGQTPLLAAVLAVFGALDVPLVYFSIWFFRTQHPQPVIGGGGSIDPRMLHVLLINWLAFSCFAALVCWFRYRLEVMRRDMDETLALEALLEPHGSTTRSSPLEVPDELSLRRLYRYLGDPYRLSDNPSAPLYPAAK